MDAALIKIQTLQFVYAWEMHREVASGTLVSSQSVSRARISVWIRLKCILYAGSQLCRVFALDLEVN